MNCVRALNHKFILCLFAVFVHKVKGPKIKNHGGVAIDSNCDVIHCFVVAC